MGYALAGLPTRQGTVELAACARAVARELIVVIFI